MDKEQKRALKKQGKAEVARVSAELRAAIKAANPHQPGEPGWSESYRQGVLKERALVHDLPLMHASEVERSYVVIPNGSAGWRPHPGGYVECEICHSVSPSFIPPNRWLYWKSCECGNISWLCLGPSRQVKVKQPDRVRPVKLLGKGS